MGIIYNQTIFKSLFPIYHQISSYVLEKGDNRFSGARNSLHKIMVQNFIGLERSQNIMGETTIAILICNILLIIRREHCHIQWSDMI